MALVDPPVKKDCSVRPKELFDMPSSSACDSKPTRCSPLSSPLLYPSLRRRDEDFDLFSSADVF